MDERRLLVYHHILGRRVSTKKVLVQLVKIEEEEHGSKRENSLVITVSKNYC